MNAEFFNRITRVYGLGVDEYLDMFESQHHKCKICKKKLVLFSSNRAECPVVDHDHGCGKVRSILCGSCNVAVGYIEKNSHRTRRAMRYLRKFGKTSFGYLLGREYRLKGDRREELCLRLIGWVG